MGATGVIEGLIDRATDGTDVLGAIAIGIGCLLGGGKKLGGVLQGTRVGGRA
jgi:hypothetical protein